MIISQKVPAGRGIHPAKHTAHAAAQWHLINKSHWQMTHQNIWKHVKTYQEGKKNTPKKSEGRQDKTPQFNDI